MCRRQLRKSGISGNAQAIEEFPELPRHLQKSQAFPEMTRHLQKFLWFFVAYFTHFKFWEKAEPYEKQTLEPNEANLTLPNLTIILPLYRTSLFYALTGDFTP